MFLTLIVLLLRDFRYSHYSDLIDVLRKFRRNWVLFKKIVNIFQIWKKSVRIPCSLHCTFFIRKTILCTYNTKKNYITVESTVNRRGVNPFMYVFYTASIIKLYILHVLHHLRLNDAQATKTNVMYKFIFSSFWVLQVIRFYAVLTRLRLFDAPVIRPISQTSVSPLRHNVSCAAAL